MRLSLKGWPAPALFFLPVLSSLFSSKAGFTASSLEYKASNSLTSSPVNVLKMEAFPDSFS